MSEITDKIESIMLEFTFLPDKEDKARIRAIAARIEAEMIPGYASCEQCGGDGECPEGENACHIKGLHLKGDPHA